MADDKGKVRRESSLLGFSLLLQKAFSVISESFYKYGSDLRILCWHSKLETLFSVTPLVMLQLSHIAGSEIITYSISQ